MAAKKKAAKKKAAPVAARSQPEPAKRKTTSTRTAAPPALLSGGNPQIPKGDGEGPVQSYIAAMPPWKHEVGKRLDALVQRHAPDARKAIRWNSPFYGIDGQGWFLSFHCFTKYVKVTLLNGGSLKPLPPIESKQPSVRYLHIHEGDPVDEALVGSWIEQAAALPGAPLF